MVSARRRRRAAGISLRTVRVAAHQERAVRYRRDEDDFRPFGLSLERDRVDLEERRRMSARDGHWSIQILTADSSTSRRSMGKHSGLSMPDSSFATSSTFEMRTWRSSPLVFIVRSCSICTELRPGESSRMAARPARPRVLSASVESLSAGRCEDAPRIECSGDRSSCDICDRKRLFALKARWSSSVRDLTWTRSRVQVSRRKQSEARGEHEQLLRGIESKRCSPERLPQSSPSRSRPLRPASSLPRAPIGTKGARRR